MIIGETYGPLGCVGKVGGESYVKRMLFCVNGMEVMRIKGGMFCLVPFYYES